jgi:hypothetical protein
MEWVRLLYKMLNKPIPVCKMINLGSTAIQLYISRALRLSEIYIQGNMIIMINMKIFLGIFSERTVILLFEINRCKYIK